VGTLKQHFGGTEENLATASIRLHNPSEAMALFGENDKHLKRLRERLEARILARGDSVRLEGSKPAVDIAESLLRDLLSLYRQGGDLGMEDVERGLELALNGERLHTEEAASMNLGGLELPKRLRPKTKGQQRYVEAINSSDITFGIGPAGTGKSYIAVAMAVAAFKAKKVKRIILTRPAVEAGEKLGFLPGDLQAKVDPYLRPLYDALFDMIDAERFESYLSSGSIEVAPLGFMRGRTLNDAFIILDEAQNTTPEQMKMFLTRMGFSSRVVVTGDITQVDLPRHQKSGLTEAQRILKNIDGIEFVYFNESDVVRHPLVGKIIRAYDSGQEVQDAKNSGLEGR
jgi:phosphate starvation-inducible protein PhoH and related proteins